MKVKVNETQIRESVSRAMSHLDVTPEDVTMPNTVDGMVSVDIPKFSGSTFHRMMVYLPNWELAEMIHGDKWDGDASDGAFRFGGGGYDPVTFECGVND